ncbi:hypothetical protein SAMN02799630_06011 [Paenibacillus sp. UNCCL117]|uniref:hypothetical protein n=1 Tax=unclassified Paenibacillus TaxID=185978 RepID=UPI000890971A|nr:MULTISPECIES: hypothetical protein [unclassified Paenibacillus]SDE65633.1 hypothetical protein SAMN04488602_1392 [Paenibacillus sp. cl123]SFW70408.1 hypothetical protein SAMN02799630_06011 [Paenibacillus sp. UNCCL117]
MYAQIFLGIWVLINAVLHLMGSKVFLRKSVISALNKEELASYQRGFVLPYLLLGTILISMGIVEERKLLSTPVFIGVYVILVSIPFALLFRNNKKHSGYYFW